MKSQKYTDFVILRRVYINSISDYNFTVTMKVNGDLKTVPVINGGLLHWKRYPKYVIRAIELLVLDLLESDKMVLHEVDRDGENRYAPNLRYHVPELLESIKARLRSKLGVKSDEP